MPRDMFVDVVTSVLAPKADRKPDPDSKKRRVDEMRGEEAHEHAERMSRWSRDAQKALASTDFWHCLEIIHKCRQPLDYFAHIVAKRHKDRSRIIDVPKRLPMPLSMLCRVCVRIRSMLAVALWC